MSNLFKSKFFLGVMIVSAMFVVAGVVKTPTAAASTCSITSTLKVGSSGSQVVCLQTALGGLTADGNFGAKTKAAVVAWQTKEGLVADGVFGAKSRAMWEGNAGNSANFPAGCTSTVGFSLTTGLPCNTPVSSGYPAGCTSSVGFSPTTGLSCATVSSYPAGCTSAVGYSPTTGASCATGVSIPANTNGAGNIASVTLDGSPSNVQVGEGSVATPVLAFQVRADAGSNLNLQNVRVNLVATGTGSTWPSRYLQGLSVWQGSTKVGSVSVANLSQNGTTYNATIALNGAMVNANSTTDLVVAVDSNTSIDTGDATNTFSVYVDSIRYSDASGAILTTSMNTTTLAQTMKFLKLSSSASTKLTLSEDSSNPKDRTVVANYTSTTNDVSMLKFTLTAAGSDMIITKMALPVTATGVTNAKQISSYYKLKYNGAVVSSFTDSQAVGLTPTITFGDTTLASTATGTSTAMNGGVGQIVIKAGTTGNFEVVADVNSMATGTGVGTAFDSGDTLLVSFPSSTLISSAVAVQDQTGATLTADSTHRTGSATGYAATFRVQGITATYVGNTFTPVKNTTTGALTSETYNTTLTVAAVGNDFFINPTALYKANTALSTTQTAGLADTSAGFNVAVLNSSNQYTTTTEVPVAKVATSVTCTSGCIQQSLSSMKIPSGTTATFAVSTTITTGVSTGGYKVAIFSTNATDGTTLSAFPNNPSYNFITPISPDNF